VGLEAGAAAAFNLGLLLEDAGDTDKAARAYQYGVEMGGASGSEGGRESGAKAAFGLGLILARTADVDGAAAAFRTCIELARLSNTAEGWEAGQKAANNLKHLGLEETADG